MNLSTWDQLCVSMVVRKERQEKGHCKEGRWYVGSLGLIMKGRSVSNEHGDKEGPEKYSNSTNPHICERNIDLE